MTKTIIPPPFVHRRLMLFLCCACVIGLIPAATPAQIRLHDPGNDELAKKTRDAFNEFSKGDANVFDTVIGNTLAMKAATLSQLNELNRQNRGDKINELPLLTWDQFLVEVTKTQTRLLVAYKGAHAIIDEALEKPDPKLQTAPNLKAALAAAQEKLTALSKDKKAKEDALKATEPKLDELKKSLDTLQDQIAASTKPVRRLSDLAEFSHLKDVWSTINDLKEWFEMAEKAGNAPGLQLTILDLGVQHQQNEVDRIKLQIERADSAEKLLTRMDQRLLYVWGSADVDADNHFNQGIFRRIYANIVPICTGPGCPTDPFVTHANCNEQILVTIGKLAKKAKNEVGTELTATTQLRNLLDVLQRYVTLIGYQKYLLLADAVEAGTDTHLFAIRLSALNTKDREMLVSHGLDGLTAYHSGGLKPEQIANFFRAAQSIALGVLAARD